MAMIYPVPSFRSALGIGFDGGGHLAGDLSGSSPFEFDDLEVRRMLTRELIFKMSVLWCVLFVCVCFLCCCL